MMFRSSAGSLRKEDLSEVTGLGIGADGGLCRDGGREVGEGGALSVDIA